MGIKRSDGSIIPSSLQGSHHRKMVEMDFAQYRCLVIKKYYTDDEKNLTFVNKQVTYDVLILSGRREGQIIPNVKLSTSNGGGQYNFEERVLRATSKAFSGDKAVPLSEHDGDVVYVSYINGHTSNPVIVNMGVQSLDLDYTGATQEDGPIYKKEFNGIGELVGKDGKHTTYRKEGEYQAEEDYFKPSEEESFLEQTIKEGEKSTKTYKSGLKIEEDGENDKVEITCASSTKVTIDGKGGVVTIDVDGGTNLITISKSGELQIKASGSVKIDAPLVDVGEGASYSSTLFENLKQEFDQHTHVINGTAVGLVPVTGVTGVPAAPLINLVGSQSVKVKD